MNLFYSNRDCGAYTIAFAEYYAMRKLNLLQGNFDIEAYRRRVACLLFYYGNMKNEDSCQSDNEL